VNHSKIAVRVPMMNEVQFLFASEPCKPFQPCAVPMGLKQIDGVSIRPYVTKKYPSMPCVRRGGSCCITKGVTNE